MGNLLPEERRVPLGGKGASAIRTRLARLVYRVDKSLIDFFARPRPRQVTERLLQGMESIERVVFFPFALLMRPAEWLLAGLAIRREEKQAERREKRRRREKYRG